MIAALYVNPVGIYSTFADVQPWGIPDRDAPKPTWLLYVGDRPPLEMDTSRPDPGFRIERMGVAERERTPLPFAEYLVALARHARAQETTAA